MRIEVLADERIGDRALAAALRRIADRLDPLPFPRPRAVRRRPSFAGIEWDTSGSGTLLTCSRCGWRSGPHPTEELAAPVARGHSNLCAEHDRRNRNRRTLDVASTA